MKETYENYEDLISIIIPVYNAEKYIKETIENIEEQTYKNWEIILVNDCSTDSTVNIIEKKITKNKNIKMINLKKNSGPAVARNCGVKEAKGRYICFQDADDFWDKEKLKIQLDYMKKNNCAFSFTGYQFVDEKGYKNGRIVKIPDKITYKQALKNTTISTITVMFDVEKIEKELIKMPNIKNEDTATWWQILKNGYIAYGINRPLSFYRRSKDTRSSNKLYSIKNTWKLYRKEQNIPFIKSVYYFMCYIINAIKRRI